MFGIHIFITFFVQATRVSVFRVENSMVYNRKRKTDRGVTDYEALLNAIKAIKINKDSVTRAGEANYIPGRSMRRYSTKFDEKVANIADHSDEELLQILRGIASYDNCAVSKVSQL